MDYQNAALFGNAPNTASIPATMLNGFNSEGGTDWGAVITNGIRGAADGAIRGLVEEKFQDGQLKQMQVRAAIQQRQLTNWVLIGLVVWVVLK